MVNQEEIKNRRWGAVVSLGLHLALLLLFFFILAWREPNPPLPEYGIELNFGLDAEGSGEVQPSTNPIRSEIQEESDPQPAEVEEVLESPKESPADPENAEPVEESLTDSDPIENVQEAPPIESPDVNPILENDLQQTEPERTIEPAQTSPDTKPQTEPETVSSSSAMESNSEKPETAAQSNHGDRVEEIGDQGDPQGDLDSRALYGNPGGGDGAALELTGWIWDFVPNPQDPSQESGRIVFEIVIDDQGDLISVRTLERTVSPNIEKIYKAEVEKLTFSPITQNTLPAPRSTGTIAFIIRSR